MLRGARGARRACDDLSRAAILARLLLHTGMARGSLRARRRWSPRGASDYHNQGSAFSQNQKNKKCTAVVSDHLQLTYNLDIN